MISKAICGNSITSRFLTAPSAGSRIKSCHRKRMAGTAFGGNVCGRFHGRYPYHVRNEGRIVKRAVYVAIGIDMEGHKDVLGMYVGQNESAKFWLSILNGLKNRGVEDILIACVDGLTGFPRRLKPFSRILRSNSVSFIRSGIRQSSFLIRNSSR